MKPDIDYIKDLLIAFEDCDNPTLDINDLARYGFDNNDKRFIFNLRILEDNNYISQAMLNPSSGLGYIVRPNEDIKWAIVPLRLTAHGHDFLDVLKNKEIFNKLKSEFKDNSIDTIFKVGKQLLDGYLKKKVDELL